MIQQHVLVVTDGRDNKATAIEMVFKGTFQYVQLQQLKKSLNVDTPLSVEEVLPVMDEKLSRIAESFDNKTDPFFCATLQKFFFRQHGWHLSASAGIRTPSGKILTANARSVPVPTELSKEMNIDPNRRYDVLTKLFPNQSAPMFELFMPGEHETDWYKEMLRGIMRKVEREKLY